MDEDEDDEPPPTATASYKGVKITVTARQGRHGWGWVYVAGPHSGVSRQQLIPTGDAALRQGMAAAEQRIDALQRP